jgi:hypothetical protein
VSDPDFNCGLTTACEGRVADALAGAVPYPKEKPIL